jgi:hypothetical protein
MIIATDYSYTIGALSSIDLLDNTGKVITADSKRYINDDLYYIVRTKDDNGKITSTTYYKIDLTTRTSSLDEANDNVVQPYESVTVTVEETVTIYTADGTSYVDIVSGNVKLMYINGSTYAVKECSYDSTTGVYTVVTTSGKTYNVSISNNVVTITAVS